MRIHGSRILLGTICVIAVCVMLELAQAGEFSRNTRRSPVGVRSAATRIPNRSASHALPPKSVDKMINDEVSLLFVFGTQEEEIRPVIQETEKRLKSLLETTGVLPNKPFNKPMIRVKANQLVFLSGEEATPQRIFEMCRKLDSSTGKEGGILVYCVCREVETARGQMLYPLAKSESNCGEGLLRKDVFDAITRNEHRFSLLVTDYCRSNSTRYDGGEASSWSQDPIYMLSALLAYGKGKYNIHAASPTRNERPLGTAEMGAFFTNVFANSMDRPIEKTGQFDMKSLVEELQAEMNNLYREVNDPENGQKSQTIMFW